MRKQKPHHKPAIQVKTKKIIQNSIGHWYVYTETYKLHNNAKAFADFGALKRVHRLKYATNTYRRITLTHNH